jgi:hypothetical protein
LSEHSGNIQGTFREHSWNIAGGESSSDRRDANVCTPAHGGGPDKIKIESIQLKEIK